MSSGQDQGLHPFGHRWRYSPGEQAGFGPSGASGLVIRAARIVDRIVEPESNFDFSGMVSQTPRSIELCQAFIQMGQVVIGSMALAVTLDQGG